MTLKKAYINLMISILLLVMSIILFVLNVSSNYVFWYHTAFYISTGAAICLFVTSIIFLSKKEDEDKHSRLLETFDWLGFTLQSFSIILILFMFFFFSSTVKQSSMYPTLQEGNIVIASQFNYEPARGDIVIISVDPIKHPGETEKLLVKRIAAMPGDLVTFLESVQDGGYKILINGVIYRHDGTDYIARTTGNEIEAMTASLDENGYVKENQYLVFGDNEANSKDSRNLGAFDREDLIGHVILRLWPFGVIS